MRGKGEGLVDPVSENDATRRSLLGDDALLHGDVLALSVRSSMPSARGSHVCCDACVGLVDTCAS